MYSQAQHEEALKAAILSHARAIYGPEHPAGSVFDLISVTLKNGNCVSVIIVYPKTKPYSAGDVVSAEHKQVYTSGSLPSVTMSYDKILWDLRGLMLNALEKQWCTDSVDK